jgi:RNA ligase
MNVETGEILARPFPKFFNYGEHIGKNMPIPDEVPQVFDKLDGSLGIMYKLNGKVMIATRGSFTSDQAKWATGWYRAHVEECDNIGPGITNLFEIIYPENRIVVNYDYSGLVHLASLDTETGEIADVFWGSPIRTCRRHLFTTYADLTAQEKPNSEGFVLFFPKANVRMKIKFPEYVRLHKLITGVSEIAIWEHLRDGKSLSDLVEKVPDEFMKWVGTVATLLQADFDRIFDDAKTEFDRILNRLPSPATKEDYATFRKAFAIRAQKYKDPGLLFAFLDGKSVSPIIWRMVRPHGQSAFKTDIDL